MPNEHQQQQLHARGVTIEHDLVTAITGDRATVQLQDGRRIALAGLFLATRTKPTSPLAEQPGCAFADGPPGPYIQTDEGKETTVSGVFACGDAARMVGNVTFAMADGAMAGMGAHRSLISGHSRQSTPPTQAGPNHHGHHAGHHHRFSGGIERWLKALEGPERDKSQ